NGVALARYHTNGNLDSSFGMNGFVFTMIGSEGAYAYSIAIQKDGKIVIAATSSRGSYNEFAVLRYNVDGGLDSTFDGDGIATNSINSISASAKSLAIQADGKILAAGYAFNGSYNEFAITRYNTNGSLDSSFDEDGIVTTLVGSTESRVNDIALQPDGKIVVAGYSYNGYNEIALARFNTDGSLDNSFDGDGKVTTDIRLYDEEANSLVVQPDGKIVIAGRGPNGTHNEFAIVRYNIDGSLDNSFDSDGIVMTGLSDNNDGAFDLTLQADGKIVAVGYSYQSTQFDFATLQYNTNGTLDSTFGGDGIVTTAIDSLNSFGTSVAIQADGKIITAGFSRMWPSGYNTFSLIRYHMASSAIENPHKLKPSLNIYPNPCYTKTSLYSNTVIHNAKIEVINYLGQTVITKENLSGQIFTIDRGNMPAGVYYIQITEDGQSLEINKLIFTDF
ncbi:MAG TPA: T9SS type A sorting domain-containing protein, partial [Lacibacter sp.]|nr:T9SS type A sorting domain-containing protein [Lacibacter sp.]